MTNAVTNTTVGTREAVFMLTGKDRGSELDKLYEAHVKTSGRVSYFFTMFLPSLVTENARTKAMKDDESFKSKVSTMKPDPKVQVAFQNAMKEMLKALPEAAIATETPENGTEMHLMASSAQAQDKAFRAVETFNRSVTDLTRVALKAAGTDTTVYTQALVEIVSQGLDGVEASNVKKAAAKDLAVKGMVKASAEEFASRDVDSFTMTGMKEFIEGQEKVFKGLVPAGVVSGMIVDGFCKAKGSEFATLATRYGSSDTLEERAKARQEKVQAEIEKGMGRVKDLCGPNNNDGLLKQAWLPYFAALKQSVIVLGNVGEVLGTPFAEKADVESIQSDSSDGEARLLAFKTMLNARSGGIDGILLKLEQLPQLKAELLSALDAATKALDEKNKLDAERISLVGRNYDTVQGTNLDPMSAIGQLNTQLGSIEGSVAAECAERSEFWGAMDAFNQTMQASTMSPQDERFVEIGQAFLNPVA